MIFLKRKKNKLNAIIRIMENNYIKRSLLKLHRKYGKDELVLSLKKELKEKNLIINKLKGEVKKINL